MVFGSEVAGLIFVVDGNEEPYEAAKRDPTGSEMKKYDDKLHKASPRVTRQWVPRKGVLRKDIL